MFQPHLLTVMYLIDLLWEENREFRFDVFYNQTAIKLTVGD